MLSKYRSRYHVYQIFLFDWEYEFRKRKKESCHPIQSISFFPNICWFTRWFLTSSLFIWIIHYLYYSQILSFNRKDFLYILLDSYTTYSDSSMFHHSFSVTDLNHFLSQLQFHYLWMSVSNSNRKNFDILSNILDFQKLFFLRSMNSTLTSGNF